VINKMARENKKDSKKSDAGALFIPGGFLLGFGAGFLIENVPAGMFIGLGLGFIVWAIIKLVRK
jgi:hypothetical protein